MPTISLFYGIAIRMYLNDHNPPHFHAIYGDYEARVDAVTGDIVDGRLPRNAARLVREWTLARQAQLMDNWQRARSASPLLPIAGLDAE